MHCDSLMLPLGVRLSSQGEKVVVAYSPEYVTREETPGSLKSFYKQRTRWNQGFLQVLRKGEWRSLPTRGQRLFARYMLASVEQELGQFEAAIEMFNEVLAIRPTEFGATIALLQTHVECGIHNIALGLFGRAAENACRALEVAEALLADHGATFNLWKAVGDASAMFSWIQGWATELSPVKLQSILQSGAAKGLLILGYRRAAVGTRPGYIDAVTVYWPVAPGPRPGACHAITG